MQAPTKILKGITWGHSRGIVPLQACAQRFRELYNIEVVWTQRTLQEFADFPIEKLTESYDLLIVDHPWVGCAAATKCVIPLDQYLTEEYLKNQSANQVGNSHNSYFYENHQWALAIDAATPVASYRADLFQNTNTELPKTWNDVMGLARENKVAAPAIPIDLLMNFYMFCLALHTRPFQSKEQMVDYDTGLEVLEVMKEFYSQLDPKFFEANPIKVAEVLSTSDEYLYCPFAYGYSNYSREGYAKKRLTYTNLVSFNDGNFLRSTLGGTGLAISSFSNHIPEAVKFAEMVVSENYQKTEYVLNGGQPGHRAAWVADLPNAICNDFFKNTLNSLDNAFMRPRYNGYLHFQDHAGLPLQDFLKGTITAPKALEKMNGFYKESQKHK